jgi:mono/diheme cytochrome c family protein
LFWVLRLIGNRRSLALICAVVLSAAGAPSFGGESGAGVFANRCAVCHGPQANGIPGSFPSLHEQIATFAETQSGRDYLIMVLTTGLLGELKVGATSYNGVMPAQSGLSEAEVAAVLDYLASGLGKKAPEHSAFTAADVAAARARHPDRSIQSTRSLRPTGAAP